MATVKVFSGKKIREFRESAGLSQVELGAMLGLLNRQQISYYEIGASVPTANRLADIARALDVLVDDLFEDKQVE